MMASRKKRRTIASWTLLTKLGQGGNADVWEVEDGGGAKSALKLPRVRNPSKEPYKRFRDEIRALTEKVSHPGVLPLIEYSLPKNPSASNPAWLVMPIATPIRRALEDAELETVVEAIREIAKTLSDLANQTVFHRDVKPGNLYRFDGRFVIGDFGLVDFPDKEAITAKGRKLGPLYFIAPEMLNDPVDSAPGPADVYSLALTMWVLITRQSYPLPGEHRLDRPEHLVRAYVDHPRTDPLDLLIARCTNFDPAKRPSMLDVANELHAWRITEARGPADPPDLSNVADRLRIVLAPRQEEEARLRDLLKLAAEASNQIVEGLREAEAVAATAMPMAIGKNSTVLNAYLPNLTTGDGPEVIWQEGRCLVAQTPGSTPVYLWSGFGLQLYGDGIMKVTGAHLLGRGQPDRSIWVESREFPVGSAQQQIAFRDLFNHLLEHLPSALESFADWAERR